MLNDFFIICALSASLNGMFLLWRRLSHSWDTWFPPFQKLARAGLWVGVALLLLALGVSVARAQAEPGVLGLGILLGLVAPSLFSKLRGRAPKDRTERGAVIATPKDVTRQVRAQLRTSKEPEGLMLGGVPIPPSAEPFHFLISGSTGSGKSVAIQALLDWLRKRGDTVILVDSGGEFMSKNWDETKDIVFNPFDSRCAPWSPLAEIEGPWDAGALARSIVPDGEGESKEWNGYAQTLLTSCLQALHAQNRTKLSDLLWAVQQASLKELQPLLAGTPAAAQLTSEKTFGSIRTIAGNYLSSYNYLEDKGEEAFSVTEFVKHAQGNFLYLTYRDDQLDSLRHMLSCVLDVASRAILSLQPNPHRRVWLIIDEFASLGKVQSIEAVATKARKVGGCLLLGLQSVAQLKDRYGEHQAQSILSCLSTTLTLRCADGDTAELMSRNLGEAEVIRTSMGSSTSGSGADSRSWSEQKTMQRLVLPSQLQQLPDLQGYLKLKGAYPVCEVKLARPTARQLRTAAFEPRDFKEKPLMRTIAPVVQAPAQQAAQPPQKPREVAPAPVAAQRAGVSSSARTGLEPATVKTSAPQEDYDNYDTDSGAPTTNSKEDARREPAAKAMQRSPTTEIIVTLRPKKPAPQMQASPGVAAAVAKIPTPSKIAPEAPVLKAREAVSQPREGSQHEPAPVPVEAILGIAPQKERSEEHRLAGEQAPRAGQARDPAQSRRRRQGRAR